MKAMSLIAALVLAVFALFFYGVGDESSQADPVALQAAGQTESATGFCSGPVLETMNSGGYTYVRVDCQGQELWAAGPETAVSVGDDVSLPEGQEMRDFHSATLDRTFDVIFFVPSIDMAGSGAPSGAMSLAQVHQGAGHAESADVDLSGIEKPAGAMSVAEVFASRAELDGKEIVVLGKVVKYNAMILGKNWIHLQDGTGEEGSNDLTITTQGGASVGDTVLVRGTVGLDRDIGAGYQYDVLIEDATVTIQ